MESGVIGFFRTLAIIIVVYYVFKFLYSNVLKVRFKGSRQSSKDDIKSNSTSKDDKLGDYVEYEDISD